MKQKTDRKRANEGITLIALIITVIVMLILAAVAINLTIGDNGIFRKSDEGAQIYKNAANNEATQLNEADTEMGSLFNQYYSENGGSTSTDNPTQTTEPTPTPSTPAEKPGKPDADGIYTENSTINGGDDSAFNPEIPKGFKPVDVDNAVWGDETTPPTEEAVKKGLVIEDEEGNQFVWIAVDGTEVKLRRYVFTETGEIDESLSKTEPTDQLKAYASASYYYTEGLKEDTTNNAHARDIQAFRTSVANHGGYYIARYEASYGTDGKPNSKISTSFTDTYNVKPNKEGQLWNNITQGNAATACRAMYDENYGVTCDLVNSYAWGTAIVFMQWCTGDISYSIKVDPTQSLSNTGLDSDEVCHINDMCGNLKEWSTESYSELSNPCVKLGGNYYYGSGYTGNRDNLGSNKVSQNTGFRPILYMD